MSYPMAAVQAAVNSHAARARVASEVMEGIDRGIVWLKAGHDANQAAGGVAISYDTVNSTWHASDYKEVTGYIIPTMLDRYHVTGDADLRTRALAMANWELTVQSGGAWDGVVFDTGQVILGLCRAYDETGTASYKTAAEAAGDWLVSCQEVDGRWITNSYQGIPHAYHARVSWGLLRLWQISNNAAYRDAAIANLEWVLTQQNATGWFANNGMTAAQNAAPLTHTISYTTRGLLESGMILNDADYINAAILAADTYIDRQQNYSDGFRLGAANFNSSFLGTNTQECLTGSAQFSIICWKLYNLTGDAKYKTAGQNMNRYLLTMQGSDAGNAGIYGGLAGSSPLNGGYMANKMLSWACKFLVDALYMESVNGNAPAGRVNA